MDVFARQTGDIETTPVQRPTLHRGISGLTWRDTEKGCFGERRLQHWASHSGGDTRQLCIWTGMAGEFC